MTAEPVQWLRPLSPIWSALVLWTVAVFLVWCVLRAARAVMSTRRGLNWAGARRLATTEYLCDLSWHLVRAGFWLFLFLGVLGEVAVGRIGSGIYHGSMQRSESPVFFYLIEAVFLAITAGAFIETILSLRKLVRSRRQRVTDALESGTNRNQLGAEGKNA